METLALYSINHNCIELYFNIKRRRNFNKMFEEDTQTRLFWEFVTMKLDSLFTAMSKNIDIMNCMSMIELGSYIDTLLIEKGAEKKILSILNNEKSRFGQGIFENTLKQILNHEPHLGQILLAIAGVKYNQRSRISVPFDLGEIWAREVYFRFIEDRLTVEEIAHEIHEWLLPFKNSQPKSLSIYSQLKQMLQAYIDISKTITSLDLTSQMNFLTGLFEKEFSEFPLDIILAIGLHEEVLLPNTKNMIFFPYINEFIRLNSREGSFLKYFQLGKLLRQASQIQSNLEDILTFRLNEKYGEESTFPIDYVDVGMVSCQKITNTCTLIHTGADLLVNIFMIEKGSVWNNEIQWQSELGDLFWQLVVQHIGPGKAVSNTPLGSYILEYSPTGATIVASEIFYKILSAMPNGIRRDSLRLPTSIVTDSVAITHLEFLINTGAVISGELELLFVNVSFFDNLKSNYIDLSFSSCLDTLWSLFSSLNSNNSKSMSDTRKVSAHFHMSRVARFLKSTHPNSCTLEEILTHILTSTPIYFGQVSKDEIERALSSLASQSLVSKRPDLSYIYIP